MIQKKKFSDALTANKEVLGGIIGTASGPGRDNRYGFG